jgi:hypothetical protein
MKNTLLFFKSTKWWMYLPGTCVTFWLIIWLVSGETKIERFNRTLFLFGNMVLTVWFVGWFFSILTKY